MKRLLFIAGVLAVLFWSVSSGDGETADRKVSLTEEKFLAGQRAYAEMHDIPLITFSEQRRLSDWYSSIDMNTQELIYLKESGFSGKKLVRTMDENEYYYIGEMKDNEPDGFGLLLVKDEAKSQFMGERPYCIQYIGTFEKGQYDGYGLLFRTPTWEDRTDIQKIMEIESDIHSSKFDEIYLKCENYVIYEGEFKKGKQTGEGNGYHYAIMDDDTGIVEYIQIEVGTFEKNELNGDARLYWDGRLYYDGSMKDGEYSGKGKSYHDNGNLCYEGEFANGDYHGKGTLYDEKGNVVYEGKWRHGDYA